MERNQSRLDWIRSQNDLPDCEPVVHLGSGCNIHPTVVLGGSGFGMERDEDGDWVRCKQLGGIIIGDDVHIGEYSVVRRATRPKDNTTIGDGSKLCTYVNVGHNCVIGRNVFIGPHVCLNGSVRIGDNAWIGGHAVVEQHTYIGEGATVGMGAVVTASRRTKPEGEVVWDVPPGEVYVGVPAVPIKFIGNVVDPDFVYGSNLKMGKFCHIHEGVIVGSNVTIRSYVELRPGTVIGDDCYIDTGVKASGKCTIGNRVTLRYDTIIARNVVIEDDVFISPQVMFINIPFVEKEKKPTIIRRGVKIGTNTTIADGVEVAEGVVIGAKSFVNKDLLEPGVYVGIPAKRLQK